MAWYHDSLITSVTKFQIQKVDNKLFRAEQHHTIFSFKSARDTFLIRPSHKSKPNRFVNEYLHQINHCTLYIH